MSRKGGLALSEAGPADNQAPQEHEVTMHTEERDRGAPEGYREQGRPGGPTVLVIFLLMGAAVFALDSWRDDGGDARRVIEVTEQQLVGIETRWVAQFGRPPTDEELDGLVGDAVQEEILYREAQRLGLDRGDAIVRRRLAQKMAFMLEDSAGVEAPSDADIEGYHAEHAGRYLEPVRTSFAHVFLSHDQREDAARDARSMLQTARDFDGDGWRQLGDPFMLRREYADRTDQEIAELFGGSFAAAVAAFGVGGWRGPIESALGTHLISVVRRTEPRAPALDEIRSRVVADLIAERRRQQNQTALDAVRDAYDVRMPDTSAAESR